MKLSEQDIQEIREYIELLLELEKTLPVKYNEDILEEAK